MPCLLSSSLITTPLFPTLKMSRLIQLASLFLLAAVGFAQIPNIIPFQVTGSLDG